MDNRRVAPQWENKTMCSAVSVLGCTIVVKIFLLSFSWTAIIMGVVIFCSSGAFEMVFY